MRSEITKKIAAETPQEVRDAVRQYGDMVASRAAIMEELIDDIEMNLDDWCRTPLVMASKFRDKLG